MEANNQTPKNWVLLRGLVRSQFHWNNFAESFREKLQLQNVQAIELPGNGFLSREKTPSDIVQVVTQLRSQVSFSKHLPFGIIGMSLGGVLATRWAQLLPEEVGHLVLINSSSALSPFYARMRPENYMSIIKQLAVSSPEQIEEFILSLTSNNPKKWGPQLHENIEFLKQHKVSFMNILKQLDLAGQTDFKNKPQAKKLVLTAKADRLVRYTCSELIAKLWDCDIEYHETAGHDLPLDDADWVIKKIEEKIR